MRKVFWQLTFIQEVNILDNKGWRRKGFGADKPVRELLLVE